MGRNEKAKNKAISEYGNNARLREAFKDGFNYFEECLEEEKKIPKWWALGTGSIIILLSIYMSTLNFKENAMRLEILSFVVLFLIILNAINVTKFLGGYWALLLSFFCGTFCLLFGRQQASFEDIKHIWEEVRTNQTK